MQNLLDELKTLLSTQPRFSQEGRMIKQAVIDAAQSLDGEFLQLLISHEAIKRHFFQDVGGVLVFDKVKLLRFVSNKAFLEDSYTAFKNKIGLITKNSDGLYDAYLSDSKEVVLGFPYKDCMLEGGQTKEEQKRSEIFWNETLAPDDIDRLKEPKSFSNIKRYDAEGVHENINDLSLNDNYIIKGNNLLALYSLLPVYRGKVKLIYIDPPYNTGNDSFNYNDAFNRSAWLTFMKDRLLAAQSLLKPDGLICVQCDDNENAYLKVLMDEIFRNGFLNNVAVKMSEASGVKMNHAKNRFPKLKEYILIYKMPNFNGFITVDKYQQKVWDTENNIYLDNISQDDRNLLIEIEAKEINDDNDVIVANKLLKNVKKIPLSKKIKDLALDSEDEINNWLFENSYRIIKTAGSSSLATLVKAQETMPNQDIAAAVSKKGILFFYITDFNRDTKQPRLQVIFADSNIFKNPCDFWQDIKTTGAIADEGNVKLSNGKKPEKILYRLIKMTTTINDIVLDFHLGSGTTTAVAHKMNRKYIGIEQLNYGNNDSVIRLQNVINGDKTGCSIYEDVNWQGGGSFVYLELAQANQNFVTKIEAAENETKLLEIWEAMQAEAFISYKVTPDMIDKNIKAYEALSFEDKKRFLIETLDKNLLYVPYCDMEDKAFGLSDKDKAGTKAFYNLKNKA